MASKKLYPFRVFLSYAHEDKELVDRIVIEIKVVHLKPLLDTMINPGKPFPNEIKQLISQAHVFMPVITEHSRKSAWVHQEIGFAIALNIPVLPLSIDGQLAEVMLSTTQALLIKGDLSNLAEELRHANLEQLVVPEPPKPHDPTFVAITPEERAKHIAKYSMWVLMLKKYGKVRAQARFTSFSIPDQSPSDPIWNAYEGSSDPSDTLRNCLFLEKKILKRHVLVGGCKLIIDPSGYMHDESARKTRLTVLLEFLRMMPPRKLKVVISTHASDTNLLIVGDHFFAEAMASRRFGYVQTIFNSHSPTVLRRLQEFDQLFDEIQSRNKTSSSAVIQEIEGLL